MRKPAKPKPKAKKAAGTKKPTARTRKKSILGCMRGSVEYYGDIVGPIGAFDNWNPDLPEK